MTCPGEHTILRMVGGELQGTPRQEVLEHISLCADCRRLLSSLAMTSLAGSRTLSATVSQVTKEPPRGGAHDRDAHEAAPSFAAIGRYVVTGICGVGAMGLVYKAYDPELDRRVALKVLRPELRGSADSQLEAERLRAEAKSMARLSHANVASVFDVGATADGVFLAMELIEGRNLAEYLRERPRSAAEILEVFLAAGRGLAAAHRAGIVHRDFKPHNVLIGHDGRVCVTDFGLAVRLEREAEQAARMLAGTPAYMAPEQLRCEPADARSDIFSFCVALHESLYGFRPLAGTPLAGAPLAGDGRRGEALSGPPPCRRVPGWLMRVIRLGLEEDAARRPAMTALLSKLERGKRRMRRWLTGGAVVVAAAAVAVTAFLAAPAPRVCADDAPAVESLFEQPDGNRIARLLAAVRPELRSAVAEKIEEFRSDWGATTQAACGDWRTGSQSEALYDARRLCLGRRAQELGAWLELLERDATLAPRFLSDQGLASPELCADAHALLIVEPPPADPETRLVLERLNEKLARLQALQEAGQYTDGLAAAEPVTAEADGIGYRPAAAEAWFARGRFEARLHLVAKAEESLTQAASLALACRDYERAVYAWIELAQLELHYQHPDKAARWLSQAEALAEGAFLQTAAQAQLLDTFAAIWTAKGDYAKALDGYQRLVETQRALLGSDDPKLARPLNNLGRALLSAGRKEAALAALEEAWRLQSQAAEIHPISATMLVNLANAQSLCGEAEKALASYQRACELYRELLPPEQPDQADCLIGTAAALRRLGRLPESLAAYEEVFAFLEGARGAPKKPLADAYNNVGNLYRDMGRLDEAQAMLRRAVELRSEIFGPEHPLTARSRRNLGAVLALQGQHEEALVAYDGAMSAFVKVFGPEAPLVAWVLCPMGDVYLQQNRVSRALESYERAVRINDAALAPTDTTAAECLAGLGKAYLAAQQPANAVPPLERARDLMQGADDSPKSRSEVLLALMLAYGRQSPSDPRLASLAREALRSAQEAGAEGMSLKEQIRAAQATYGITGVP